MGRKLGGVPLWGRGAGSKFNTIWPGSRSTCTRSFVLIHSTIWPQCTNVTNRTNRQTTVPQHRANCFTNGCPTTTTTGQPLWSYASLGQVIPPTVSHRNLGDVWTRPETLPLGSNFSMPMPTSTLQNVISANTRGKGYTISERRKRVMANFMYSNSKQDLEC